MLKVRPIERPPEYNIAKLQADLDQETDPRFTNYWKEAYKGYLSPTLFSHNKPIRLEIGAGSGQFIHHLAELYPDDFFIAIERARNRGRRLLRRTEKSRLKNLASFRGNVIPALMHGIPDGRISTIYILYPPPWYKNAQRRNRWYLHPIMPHLLRILSPNGKIVWATDQEFYIKEALYACERHFHMNVLHYGSISPNAENELGHFPDGRSKFEEHFMDTGEERFELIVEKQILH